MCLACREMKDKRQLLRIVKDKEQAICVDITGKAPGRGAYICKSAECFERAVKQRQLERAFKMAINEEVYEELRKEIISS